MLMLMMVVLVSLFCLSGIEAAASSYLHFDQALMVNCVQAEIKATYQNTASATVKGWHCSEHTVHVLEGWQMLWEVAGEVQVLGGAGQCKWRWRGRCRCIARKGGL